MEPVRKLFSPRHQRISAPTLVVSATGDRFVAPAHSRELADGIAGARLVQVDGGHASIFEHPEQTLAALLEFLAAVERPHALPHGV